MKVDIGQLMKTVESAKNAISKRAPLDDNLPKHEAWVPAPDKDEAAALGVRWNKIAKRHEFAAVNPADHPAVKYSPDNFVKLTHKIPFDCKDEFKELGVVSRQVDGVWGDYVMVHADYEDLIKGLSELGLL